MKNRNYCIVIVLVVLLIQTIAIVSAQAGVPWKWQFNMVNLKSETPMQPPVSIFFDEKRQRFYVADPAANSLHSFAKEGEYLSTFNPSNKIDQPYAMVRDNDDILWVVAKGQNSLTRIDLKAQALTENILIADGHEVFPDRLGYADNTFFVLDKLSGNVFSFNNSLEKIGVYGCQDCTGGFIDFVVKGNSLWALAQLDRVVYEFEIADGSIKNKIKLDADLEFPVALEVGGDLFYILDRHAGTVNVFNNTGEFKYSFLGKGSLRNTLYYPEDLLLDKGGRLYVVDSGNIRVEVFSR